MSDGDDNEAALRLKRYTVCLTGDVTKRWDRFSALYREQFGTEAANQDLPLFFSESHQKRLLEKINTVPALEAAFNSFAEFSIVLTHLGGIKPSALDAEGRLEYVPAPYSQKILELRSLGVRYRQEMPEARWAK